MQPGTRPPIRSMVLSRPSQFLVLSLTSLMINLHVYRYSTPFNHDCPCPCMRENLFNIGNVFWMAITLPADPFPDLWHSNQMLTGTKLSIVKTSNKRMKVRHSHSIKWFSVYNSILCRDSTDIMVCSSVPFLCKQNGHVNISYRFPHLLCQSADWIHRLIYKLNNQLCLTVQHGWKCQV